MKMAKDVIYTNGVIAVKENKLLGEKLLKLTESDADDAFKAIVDGGFGRGAGAVSVYEFEKLISAEERELDGFVLEYAPSDVEKEYLLSPRDFHNAKAIVKGLKLNEPCDKMLAPDGLIPSGELKKIITEKDYSKLGKELKGALEEYDGLPEKDVSGAETGLIFDRAAYARLLNRCSKNFFLKRVITAKIDMSNILTVMRSDSFGHALKCFFGGGKLKEDDLKSIFDGDIRALDGTPYREFIAMCAEAESKGLPYTAAEREFDVYETRLLHEKRHELKRAQPFLYYVLRRRAEIADVRILFVCLTAGMKPADIKRRLRSVYDR